MTKKYKPLSKRSFIAVILLIFGFVLAGTAIILYVRTQYDEPRPPLGSMSSTSVPSSVKPTPQSVAIYKVPPNNPKYISIPAISTGNLRVFKLGLLRNGSIAAPSDIYDTGWYENSAKPGESGSMFIYGHLSSWTAEGVFYNLKKLKAGDKITVTNGADKTFSYQVISTKQYRYNQVDMKHVLAPIDAAKPGLNLMTCAGQIIKGTSEFDERLVVFTSLVGS